jgi:RimJ/RimL family protein N-acetyltransferase
VPNRVIDWLAELPELVGEKVSLRELRPDDAATIAEDFNAPEVRRFMWAPPPTAAAFQQFIEWARAERATGRYVCYGVVPCGEEHACGVFELRQLQPKFFRGELGFVLAPRLWGRGIFPEAAGLLLDFAFDTMKVHRIEARAAIDNDRGNAALKRLGARREGTLRGAFLRDGQSVDQYLWAILASEWRERRTRRAAPDQPSDK